MAYIMFVNPAILEKAGMDVGAVFLAAAAGSIIMGLYANYPIALAPGMGLNAYFAFTVVPELGGNWQLALGCVFISGVLFFALSLSPLRAWLIDALPMNLKLGIAAGIGLVLALIGLQNAGIVADDPVTICPNPRLFLPPRASWSLPVSPRGRFRSPSSSACLA
jgi:adenine/guanine/hypoxanthine permease